MESSHGIRRVVDIASTVYNWPQSFLMLPAIHALTGFDSTSQIFGIDEVRDQSRIHTRIIVEGSDFVVSCYRIQKGLNMTNLVNFCCVTDSNKFRIRSSFDFKT